MPGSGLGSVISALSQADIGGQWTDIVRPRFAGQRSKLLIELKLTEDASDIARISGTGGSKAYVWKRSNHIPRRLAGHRPGCNRSGAVITATPR
jgi:hypothetical protein